MLALGAALCTALAAAVLLPMSSPARDRLRPGERSESRSLPVGIAPVGVGLLVIWLLGGVTGWVLGALAAGLLLRQGMRRTSPRAAQKTARRVLELPVAVDLLASCLLVGTTPMRALDEVAVAVGGSLADDLRTVAEAMRDGASADEGWALVDAADLQSVASLLRRTSITGAAVAPMLSMLAEQHRQQARLVALDAARTLGVRAAGPLGLCFLPAFVLVAVVPLVVSLLPWDEVFG